MAIVAGIDEAGYGPILGPLVVSRVAFEVPDDIAHRDLWRVLHNSVTGKVSRRDPRLPIVDSKKLHHSQAGLAAIERSALAMLRVGQGRCDAFGELLRALCPDVVGHLGSYPWYRQFDPTLPVACDPQIIALKANAIVHDMREQGLRFVGARCRVLPEGHFNRLVERTRNKATVLWVQTLQLVGELLAELRGRKLLLLIDRQGGRIRYVQSLLTAFDGAALEVLEETPQLSRYRLNADGCDDVTVEFRQAGEDAHLPVALASIFSKYLRELFMAALNQYWQQHIDQLKCTAGYYEDGRRFLRQIAPAIQSLDIDQRMLVRSR